MSDQAIADLIFLAMYALVFVPANWLIFGKAGVANWLALVPFLNAYYLLKVAGMSGWWFPVLFVPYVNVVPGVVFSLAMARRFGKGLAFAFGLIFLPFPFYWILAFGSSEYEPAEEQDA